MSGYELSSENKTCIDKFFLVVMKIFLSKAFLLCMIIIKLY